LEKSLDPLPADTHYAVRLASVLGGKYVEVVPGSDKRHGVADGGTFSIGHEDAVVDLDTAFRTFGPKTQHGLRGAIGQFGNAVAGRGNQFNDTISSPARLTPPLEDLLRVLADPSTRLAQFLAGAAATTAAVAPLAPTFSALLSDAATTFGALDGS